MKKLLLIFSLFFCFQLCLAAQDYRSLIQQAEALAQEKAYGKAVSAYQSAFELASGNRSDLYNAACMAALAGDPDRAFVWLNLSIEHGWVNLEHLKKDSDLLSLHKHKNWDALLASLQKKIDFIEKDYNKPLQKELLIILEEDQKYREQLQALQQKFGRDSKEVQDLWQQINEKDVANLQKIEYIIKQHGWVGPDKVGAKASGALFLVIQHADLATQQTYLPIMRAAVQDKKARPDSLALLEDRVAMRNGKKQIYGSQITVDKAGVASIFPIEDPDHVDQRRASVGLSPLADYVRIWNIVWDAEAHKKSSESDSRIK